MPCPGSITVRRKPIARRFDVPGEPSLGRYRLGGVGRLRKLRRARVSSLSNTIELGRDPAVADGVGFRPAFSSVLQTRDIDHKSVLHIPFQYSFVGFIDLLDRNDFYV